MLKQTSLCFINTYLLPKHCTQLLQKYFLFLFFVSWNCFVKHESVKIFNVHIMWLVFINHKQQIHGNFKLLIWNVDWKGLLVLVTKNFNANIVFLFNFIKIFFLHRKFHSIIIKIINKFFIHLCNFFWTYFYGINIPNMTSKKTFWSLFLMSVSPFLDFLIQ